MRFECAGCDQPDGLAAGGERFCLWPLQEFEIDKSHGRPLPSRRIETTDGRLGLGRVAGAAATAWPLPNPRGIILYSAAAQRAVLPRPHVPGSAVTTGAGRRPARGRRPRARTL